MRLLLDTVLEQKRASSISAAGGVLPARGSLTPRMGSVSTDGSTGDLRSPSVEELSCRLATVEDDAAAELLRSVPSHLLHAVIAAWNHSTLPLIEEVFFCDGVASQTTLPQAVTRLVISPYSTAFSGLVWPRGPHLQHLEVRETAELFIQAIHIRAMFAAYPRLTTLTLEGVCCSAIEVLSDNLTCIPSLQRVTLRRAAIHLSQHLACFPRVFPSLQYLDIGIVPRSAECGGCATPLLADEAEQSAQLLCGPPGEAVEQRVPPSSVSGRVGSDWGLQTLVLAGAAKVCIPRLAQIAPRLRVLRLTRCGITSLHDDAAIRALPFLQRLELRDCSGRVSSGFGSSDNVSLTLDIPTASSVGPLLS
jgi:hypothetical protein